MPVLIFTSAARRCISTSSGKKSVAHAHLFRGAYDVFCLCAPSFLECISSVSFVFSYNVLSALCMFYSILLPVSFSLLLCLWHLSSLLLFHPSLPACVAVLLAILLHILLCWSFVRCSSHQLIFIMSISFFIGLSSSLFFYPSSFLSLLCAFSPSSFFFHSHKCVLFITLSSCHSCFHHFNICSSCRILLLYSIFLYAASFLVLFFTLSCLLFLVISFSLLLFLVLHPLASFSSSFPLPLSPVLSCCYLERLLIVFNIFFFVLLFFSFVHLLLSSVFLLSPLRIVFNIDSFSFILQSLYDFFPPPPLFLLPLSFSFAKTEVVKN